MDDLPSRQPRITVDVAAVPGRHEHRGRDDQLTVTSPSGQGVPSKLGRPGWSVDVADVAALRGERAQVGGGVLGGEVAMGRGYLA